MTYTAKKGKTKKKKALRSSPLEPTHFYSEQYAVCHISRVQNPPSRALPLRMALLTRAFHRKIIRKKKKGAKQTREQVLPVPQAGKNPSWQERLKLEICSAACASTEITALTNTPSKEILLPWRSTKMAMNEGTLVRKSVTMRSHKLILKKKPHACFFFFPF